MQLLAPLPCLWQDARAEALPDAAITLLQGCVLSGSQGGTRDAGAKPETQVSSTNLGADAALRALRTLTQVWLSPVPPQGFPTLHMVQDPTSASQVCQPLPQ